MRLYLAALTILGSACALPVADSDEQVDETQQDVDSANGTSLNGTSLNGTSLNGTSLNGTSLNGTSLNGTSLNGTTISATSTTAPPMSGSGMVGSTWTGYSSNGTTVKLRVDSAAQGTAPNADLWFYAMSYQTAAGWSPLCGLDASNQPIKAVTVAGEWVVAGPDTAHYSTSTNKFTFACRGKAIAKCVELGYKTFKGYTSQLQACVRLLRADYCGTGTSYTVDGTMLNLYDRVGVQLDTNAWNPEAEWLISGARCINNTHSTRYDLLGSPPACVSSIAKSSTCGTFFGATTLLIDELP